MDLSIHHTGVSVADLERSVAFYEALGLVEPGVPVSHAGAGITMAFICDPDRTSIEILSLG